MSAIFYMVQDVKMMKNVPFVLMLFMGTYALSLVDTANKKERFGLTVNRLSNQTFIYYRTKRKMRDALCKTEKF